MGKETGVTKRGRKRRVKNGKNGVKGMETVRMRCSQNVTFASWSLHITKLPFKPHDAP